jgi:hypothetical protein
MVITGRYYDSEQGAYTEHAESVYAVRFDRTRRGQQTVTVRINRLNVTLPPIQVRVPANAVISLNTAQHASVSQRLDCQQIYLKGVPFDDVPEKLRIKVRVNGIIAELTNGNGISFADLSTIDTNVTGLHSVTITLDDAQASLPIFVADIEPEVFFDYGYWRHAGNPKGTAPGGAERYTVPLGRSLVLAPILSLVKDPVFSWQVQGGAHTVTGGYGGDIFTLTPSAVGNYTVTVHVSGASIATGAPVDKTVTTTVVCLPALPSTPPAEVENALFTPPLRHFSPGQFTKAGSGYGWSLGSVLGYEVWRWRAVEEFHIYGNAFGFWEEPGIVWVSCDENRNGLPDDTWYELKGSEDETPRYRSMISRRYAVTWFDLGNLPEENEYGQLIAALCWVDSKGRSGFMSGAWPDVWGVSAPKVTYTGTMIQDTGEPIYGYDSFFIPDVDWGYVDGGYLSRDSNAYLNGKFFVSNAMQRDGSPANLPWIDFIKVQTAIFSYGGVFGEISTEIYSADGLGVQTDFPLP